MLNPNKIQLLKTQTVSRTTDRRDLVGEYVGVELELEGFNLPQQVTGWACHREGSLRGEGVEYVTNGPVAPDALPDLLVWLKKKFINAGSELRPSYRGSTHVHYNVLPRTLDSIIRSIIVFSVFEPILMKVCGDTRDGNLFCVPSYDCSDFPAILGRFYETIRAGRGVSLKTLARGKYSSLNLNTLSDFGTMEVRTFPATIDTDEILRYVNIVCNLLRDNEIAPNKFLQKVMDDPVSEARKIIPPAYLPTNTHSLVLYGLERGWELSEVYHKYMGE